MSTYIPRDAIAAILEVEIAERNEEGGEGGITACALAIAAAKAMTFEAAYRRISAIVNGETERVNFETADRLLTGLDRQDAWHGELLEHNPPFEPDYTPPASSVCEDCGGAIEEGTPPIDLFRPDPTAPPGRVWDSTKQRWVRRPKNAKAGGRRFREWHLCRACRANAVRDRALRGSSNGRGKTLHTKDRVEPRRGGRPRLLTDDELRAAHEVYEKTGLSRREIAKRLLETREKGTQTGYEQALLYGWRKLQLPLRSRSAQIAISRHGRSVDWQPKEHRHCKRRLRNGKRCTQWVRRIDGELAEDGLCCSRREE